MFQAKRSPFVVGVVTATSAFILSMGVQPPPVLSQTDANSDQKILHMLNRVTFGPRPGDVDDVKKMGVDKFLEQQLHPDTIPLPAALTASLSSNVAINTDPIELARRFYVKTDRKKKARVVEATANSTEEQKQTSIDLKKEQSSKRKEAYATLYTESTDAKIRRAVESPRQLQEVMVDFWFNHFNISNNKGRDRMWTGAYEQQAIRPYALGKFHELVMATSHHPAMLFYLDNWQNSKPESDPTPNPNRKKSKFKGLNENYARELMELHTLGVDGGYTQKDVIELARVLTGLGLAAGTGRKVNKSELGQFGSVFDSKRHDFGDKVLLGHTIKGSGEAEIGQAVNILCSSPATAHHISYQLAQYFVADAPPKPLVDRLTSTYQKTDGDITAMLGQLFHSPEFWDTKYIKYKNPFRYVVSSMRAANVSLTDYKPVLSSLKQQGMPLYACLTPDGYKNTQEAWLSPSSLLRRIQFATSIGSGRLANNNVDPADSKEISNSMKGLFEAKTLNVVASSPPNLRSAVLLGSPEFMNY